LNAGRYDGTLGVLGAIEAVRTLTAAGRRARRTIEVICLAGEEPRFGWGCLGSRALTGSLDRAALDAVRDRDGITLAEALLAYGLDPDRIGEARLDPSGIHSFVELHVEQGSVLETEGVPVGVVTHIAAPHDLLVTFTGEAAHSGATPMTLRRDAFAAAAEATLALEQLGQGAAGGTAVATVGVVRVRPGAINVIPGQVELEVDIRDRDVAVRTRLVEDFIAAAKAIAARRIVAVDVTTLSRDQPITCSELVVDAARAACSALGASYMDIVSGAYHDALVLAAQIPVGMIFVPSSGGISHSPLEYTAPEHIDGGVDVLLGTLSELAEAA
jgi:hydantoinase/carbamoylase family amidase